MTQKPNDNKTENTEPKTEFNQDKKLEEQLGLRNLQDELNENVIKLNKETEEYNSNLQKNSKTKNELIIPINCTIESVIGTYKQVSHTPYSEIRYGAQNQSYHTGHTYYTELEVKTNTEIKVLLFNGWPPLQAGDQIRAHIFKAELKYEKTKYGLDIATYLPKICKTKKSHWIEREFDEIEDAIKIEKIVKNKVVATYLN